MYRVKSRQRDIAKQIGVVIRPSERANKKLDVYRDGFYVASIGDVRYNDYYDYLAGEQKGKENPGVAALRRNAYYARHQANLKIPYSPGWYSWKLLWEG